MDRHDELGAARRAALRLPPPFAVAVHRDAGRTVVAVRGDLDLATVGRVQEALRRADEPLLVLDLRHTSFLDTSGLRMVIEQQRDAERDGRRFCLVAGPPAVQRLFEIAGLTRRVEFLDPADVPQGDAPAD